ncbi:MAG: DNA polymerase I [Selenomonadaceae bacterium]|nr:DNA polymerase I [Selenomonadaceae bacterium]
MAGVKTTHSGERFILLDGSSLLFRAFYALPDLTDAQGEHTNAILGFSNMLVKLIRDYDPTYLMIAFDKSRHTFRTEKFAAYKGTRDKTPEELVEQIPRLAELADAMGIQFLEKDGYEADDILGTLGTQAAAAGLDTYIVTGDHDALQLVRPNLRVMMTKKGISQLKIYDEAAFREEYGFEPIRLIDLKGLMGDASDNIPGIPGIGPKKGTSLLVSYGSLEGVYEHIEEIGGKKTRETIRENEAIARLSKELATIELQVPGLQLRVEDYRISPDIEKLAAFSKRYEMRKLLRDVEKLYRVYGGAPEPDGGDSAFAADLFATEPVKADLSYENGMSGSDLAVFAQADCIGIAAVFAGTHPFETMQAAAISDGVHRLFFSGDAWNLADGKAWISARRGVVFDGKRYRHAGIASAALDDVKIEGYLLDPERSKQELAQMVRTYLPDRAVPDAFSDEKEKLVWEAEMLLALQPVLEKRLKEREMWKLYQQIERPLIAVLAGMEQNGIYVNRQKLEQERESVGDRLAHIEADIYTMAGHTFKLNSPKQLGTVLFDELHLPPVKKTKTGYSTNAEVLESLRDKHPIVEQVLAYRLWSKLKSTYLDGIDNLIHADTGRVYTNFNQTVTATGRLSSSDPNLQNIPVRTEEGRTIRALFEPSEGYDCLLSADYSQIELRILAHMSGDENFIDAFRRNQDIHARTASEVFGVSLDAVTPELRRRAKAVNFGIVYGISDYGLSRDLHISRKEAGAYIEAYFARYPKVKAFMDAMVAKAHQDGFVTTLYGRRRELPAIHSRNFNQRSLAERMAMNTPIQGTAADIIKIAMIRAWQGLAQAKCESRILIQVHDELVVETKESEREQVTAILKDAMEHAAKLAVPLCVDVHYGKNWADAK